MPHDEGERRITPIAGIVQGAAIVADLETQLRLRSVSVNEATARRLRQLGMTPLQVAQWFGYRRER